MKFLIKFLYFTIIVGLLPSVLAPCPFASYKRGVFNKKKVVDFKPSLTTQETLNCFHQRYEVALSELQYQYPFDFIQTKQQIRTLEQFCAKVDTYAEKKALTRSIKCLKLIVDKNYKSHLQGKERYKHFIDSLRSSIEYKNSASWADLEVKAKLSDILEQLSYSHFTVNLNHTSVGYQFFWGLLPSDIVTIKAEDLNAKVFMKMVNKIFPSNTPQVLISKLNQKMHSFLFSSWDGAINTLRSKIVQYQWGNQELSVLRMSSPVYGKNYNLAVDPIFLEYLRALKTMHKKHLYVCNLNTTGHSRSKYLKVSKLLESISKEDAYKEVLLFVVLPFESPFYKQGNLGLLRASYFKETFLNSMLLNQEGFYFPSKLLMDAKFTSFLGDLIERIHKIYFKEDEFLERAERCQFIDIAYAHISKYLIEQNNIDLVNWSGYNGIDHSMNAVAVFDVLLQSVSNPSISFDSTLYISLWPSMAYLHSHPDSMGVVRSFSAIQKISEINNDFLISDMRKRD